jgi:5-formyltetrahydrofolate cyclo-ligase
VPNETTDSRPAAAAKSALRADARRRRAAAAAAEPLAGERVAGRLTNLPWPPGPVAGYWPIASELDPRPLMAALAARGFALALPAVVGSALEFRPWRAGAALVEGPFGTHEPPAGAILAPQTILVPLLAFDRGGRRLGYGRGFYDRALRGHPRALAVGLAYAAQEVERVPTSEEDAPLHWVLTENEAMRVR